MYMTSDRREKLTQNLMDKRIELRQKGEKTIKAYEVAFQEVIESTCRGKLWHEVTNCKIFDHLLEHKKPTETVIEIVKQIKEELYED